MAALLLIDIAESDVDERTRARPARYSAYAGHQLSWCITISGLEGNRPARKPSFTGTLKEEFSTDLWAVTELS